MDGNTTENPPQSPDYFILEFGEGSERSYVICEAIADFTQKELEDVVSREWIEAYMRENGVCGAKLPGRMRSLARKGGAG